MKNRHLITMLILSVIALKVNAQLPDEVNYKPYHQRYLDSKNKKESKQKELEQSEFSLEQIITSIEETNNRIDSLRYQISNDREEIYGLEAEIPSLDSELENSHYRLNTTLNNIESLNDEKRDLSQSIEELERDMRPIRREFNDKKRLIQDVRQRFEKTKEEIQDKENHVGNNENKIHTYQSEISSLKARKKNLERKISRLQSEIEDLRDNPENESIIKQKQYEVNDSNRQIINFNIGIERSRNSIQRLETEIRSFREDISHLKSEKQRFKHNMENLERRISEIASKKRRLEIQIDEVQDEISDIQNRISNLSFELNHLRDEIHQTEERLNYISRRIPSLNDAITRNQSTISTAELRLNDLNSSQNNISQQIYIQKQDLQNLIKQTEQAYSYFKKRKKLHNNYKIKAIELAKSQTSPAISLGDKKGIELSDTISSKIATVVSDDYGSVQAKLIGYIRGEITGYPQGYQVGYTDSESITKAQDTAKVDAKKAAYDYTQTHFAPKFFENHLTDLLKRPLQKMKYNKGLNKFFLSSSSEHEINLIKDITEEEIALAKNYQTIMDEKIIFSLEEEIRVKELFNKMQSPINAYQKPEDVPYQEVNCSDVYKNLEYFTKICQKAYQIHFAKHFNNKALQTFKELYSKKFIEKFNLKEPIVRSERYQPFYEESKKVAFNEAKIKGKKDIYDESYTTAYHSTYNQTIPVAKQEINDQAKEDAQLWVSNNPVITIKRSTFSKEGFKGGQSGKIVIDLKNISPQLASQAALVEVSNSNNLLLDKGSYVLSEVQGESIKTFEIPFTINPKASSSEFINFEASLRLPRDKYQSSRKEKISLTQKLIENPKETAVFKYSKNPKIKALFKYYIHTFQVDISPEVEDLKSGYEVSISAVGESARYIKMKNTIVKTEALRAKEVKTVKFQYTFPKSAKRKRINLQIKVKYQGEILRDESHFIIPR